MTRYRIPFLVLTFLIGLLGSLSILSGSSEAEEADFCQGAVVRKLGTPQCATVLTVCIDGLVYRNTSMEKERLIHWQDITRWQYYGPKQTGSDRASRQYASLEIVEWTGTKHRFRICGTGADGQRVFESLKRYHSKGMF